MEVLYEIEASDHRFGDYWRLVEIEFGHKIPWLEEIQPGCLYGHLFIDNGQIIGGVAIFKPSPEYEIINRLKETLLGKQGIYASCFLLTEPFRGTDCGRELLRSALKETFRKEQTFVWGVVTSKQLVHYYQTNFSADVFPIISPDFYLVRFNNKPC